MTHQQWADEVKKILEYWYNKPFEYFLLTRAPHSTVYKFKVSGHLEYGCAYDVYPNVVDAAIYLTYWFDDKIYVDIG